MPITLLLMRHAKSSWDEPQLSDKQRPLNQRGETAGLLMGRHLREQGLLPELILSSSALRALQTAALVARSSEFEGTIEVRHSLYLADPDVYLTELSRLTGGCVLVIGHNPGIEQLFFELSGAREHFSTAAVGRVDLPIEELGELRSRVSGRGVFVWRPKELLV